jgi:hypothetical protein
LLRDRNGHGAIGFPIGDDRRHPRKRIDKGEARLRPKDEGRLYTFNPVVLLRAIAAHGLAAETMARLGERLRCSTRRR